MPAGNDSGLVSSGDRGALSPAGGTLGSAGGASSGQAFSLSLSHAPLLRSLAGSPWDVEAVRAYGVDPSGAETRSSAFLAFPGITKEKEDHFSYSYRKCQKQSIPS